MKTVICKVTALFLPFQENSFISKVIMTVNLQMKRHVKCVKELYYYCNTSEKVSNFVAN